MLCPKCSHGKFMARVDWPCEVTVYDLIYDCGHSEAKYYGTPKEAPKLVISLEGRACPDRSFVSILSAAVTLGNGSIYSPDPASTASAAFAADNAHIA